MCMLTPKHCSGFRRFSLLSGRRIWIIILLLALIVAIPCPSSGTEDWQKEYEQLKAKIEREEGEPRASPKNLGEYIRWMRIKAADRNKATELTGKAQLSGNPYWQNKFLDLKELAQDSGNSTLWTGGYVFMRVETKGAGGRGDNWKDAVFKAGPDVGQRLFRSAEQDGFDKEIIRDYASCLMRFANGDVEEGDIGLYEGRRSEIGHLDQDGVLVPPKRDFDVSCERRDAFTTIEEGEPREHADTAMEWVNEIRDLCKWYKLQGEYDDSTDLMEKYLQEKKVLCDLPYDKGHYFFLKLADKYDLPKAEEHADGFYATIYGKVELDTMEGREPARGAKVIVRAPKDKDAPKNRREWTTTTDEDGKYKMKGAILHKNCSPFEITAEYKDCEEEKTFVGPLEEPDSSFEYKKNLVIHCLRCLEIDCVWSSPPLSPEINISYGGTAHVEICFKVGEPIDGGPSKDLKGVGRSSQKCWVKTNYPKWRIENKRCTDFNFSVAYGSYTGDRYGFVLKIDHGRLSYDVVEEQDGHISRWPREYLGVEKILSGIIFEILEKPDAVFKESEEDLVGTHYEVTASWKK